jgi:hypothetical protein
MIDVFFRAGKRKFHFGMNLVARNNLRKRISFCSHYRSWDGKTKRCFIISARVARNFHPFPTASLESANTYTSDPGGLRKVFFFVT